MSNKCYDRIKLFTLIWPILITAVIQFQHIFGFTPIIAEAMAVIETAAVSILKVASDKYFENKLIIEK